MSARGVTGWGEALTPIHIPAPGVPMGVPVLSLPTDVSGKLDASRLGVPNGVATLNTAGQIPEHQMPAISFIDVYERDSEQGMLGLVTQKGDVCVRSDLNRSFIRNANPGETLAGWTELRTPTDAVLTVDGRVGAVDLSDRYAQAGHTHAYLPLSGGALTGGFSITGATLNWALSGLANYNGGVWLNTANATAGYLGHNGLGVAHWSANGFDVIRGTLKQGGVNVSLAGHTHAWSEVTGKPTSFPADAHSHPYLPLTGGVLSGAFIPAASVESAWLFGPLALSTNSAVAGDVSRLVIDHGSNGGQVYLDSELKANGYSDLVIRTRHAGFPKERLRINELGIKVAGKAVIGGSQVASYAATITNAGAGGVHIATTGATFGVPGLNLVDSGVNACLTRVGTTFAIGTFSAHDMVFNWQGAERARVTGGGFTVTGTGSFTGNLYAGNFYGPDAGYSVGNSAFNTAMRVFGTAQNIDFVIAGTQRLKVDTTGVNVVGNLKQGGVNVSLVGHTHDYLPLTGGTVANLTVTGNLVSAARAAQPFAPYKLYRRDATDDYSVQTHWTSARWRLQGYSAGDAFHAECEVGYADSAGNAATVGGAAPSVNHVAGTIPLRSSDGIHSMYFNSGAPQNENPPVSQFITDNGDGWYRKSSVQHVKNTLGVKTSTISTAEPSGGAHGDVWYKV
jgi:hypothetical protein